MVLSPASISLWGCLLAKIDRLNSSVSLEEILLISTKKRHNQTTKIKVLLRGDKISTPMDKFGGQRGTNSHTQQYNNNTYKPRHQDNVVLGGLMDLSQFED